MASAAAARVKKYLETLLDNKCASLDKSVADISFYIADRSLDPLTPLIHSLTYESMLLDLDRVTIEGDS